MLSQFCFSGSNKQDNHKPEVTQILLGVKCFIFPPKIMRLVQTIVIIADDLPRDNMHQKRTKNQYRQTGRCEDREAEERNVYSSRGLRVGGGKLMKMDV